MGEVRVINLSDLTESAALMRVAVYIAGDKQGALHDSQSNRDIDMLHCGSKYTVINKKEVRKE